VFFVRKQHLICSQATKSWLALVPEQLKQLTEPTLWEIYSCNQAAPSQSMVFKKLSMAMHPS
jgi:hypothetical protein